MSIRNFKTAFSIVFALILGFIGLSIGLAIRSAIPALTVYPIWLETFVGFAKVNPNYLNGVTGALCALGVLFGTIIGPKAAQTLINAGNSLEQMSAKDKIAVGFGTVIGIAISTPFFIFGSRNAIGLSLAILLAVAFVYLGIRATLSMKDEFRFIGGAAAAQVIEEANPTEGCKILDTNVIIDGRIADVCRTGFLEGTLYVPGFVLDELQHIADSGDSLKRARGRRGLDILNNMQKELPLIVRVWDKELEKAAQHDEVDTKLVKLAKALKGSIVTNDFNLNKVAVLQGVQVLNVNELANALKPVVLPGEVMMVAIVKEGKEPNQGVAYLDDGTMIVVEDGRRFLDKTLGVIVTSVLQTVAGKMIFARTRSEDEGDTFDYTNNRDAPGGGFTGSTGASRGDYSRRGPSKKVR